MGYVPRDYRQAVVRIPRRYVVPVVLAYAFEDNCAIIEVAHEVRGLRRHALEDRDVVRRRGR